ncbi:hypothetical protein [Micromonospora sp. SH-82]|uniref:YncE family protein n=1 Tax=Micromonospora sp. SH-82 TaxID=3132938 RepID=UPI003EC088F7
MIAALAATVVTVAAPGPGAAAQSRTVPSERAVDLGVEGFWEMVVDSTNRQLYFSTGSMGSGVRVTDLSGGSARQVSMPDARGMALSPDATTLYVALRDSDTIVALSTRTLTETARYPLGRSVCPTWLAWAGEKLYFGYGCSSGRGLLGSLDVRTESPEMTFGLPLEGTHYREPLLRTSPGDPNLLLTGDPTSGAVYLPSRVTLHDVSSGTPEKLVGLPASSCDGLHSAALLPDATRVFLACTRHDTSGHMQMATNHVGFSTADLSPVSVHPSGRMATAVTTSPDGSLVVVGYTDGHSVVQVQRLDGSLVHRYEFPAQSPLQRYGLAAGPDGTLYAVTRDGERWRLWVLSDYTRGGSSLGVSTPVGNPDGSVSVRGTLSFDGEAAPGRQTVRVTRQAGTTVHHLPDVTTDAGGGFVVSDVPTDSGPHTYSVTYPGSPTRVAATGSAKLWVDGANSSVKLTAPSSATRAAKMTVTGQLAWVGSAPPRPWTLTVVRKDAAGSGTLPSVSAAANGTFSFTDTPPVGGANTYTVALTGNRRYAGSSGSATVQVSRAATSLKVTTNAADHSFGGKATVTAQLGTTYTNRSVCLHAQQHGESKFQLKCGKVNSAGKLTTTMLVNRRTVFSATFTGDHRYAPASASRTITSKAMMTSSVVKPSYTKSGSYRVFQKKSNPVTKTWVSPNNKGACVKYTVQAHRSGKWKTVTSGKCRTVNSSSQVTYTWTGSRATGVKYRVRATLTATTRNSTSTSDWEYFRFR